MRKGRVILCNIRNGLLQTTCYFPTGKKHYLTLKDVVKSSQQSLQHAVLWFLDWLIFDPEARNDTFLRNIASRTKYTALFLGIWEHSYWLFTTWWCLRASAVITVFWDVTLSSPSANYQCSGGSCSLHRHAVTPICLEWIKKQLVSRTLKLHSARLHSVT
jgi:hypothetical protein